MRSSSGAAEVICNFVRGDREQPGSLARITDVRVETLKRRKQRFLNDFFSRVG